MKGVKKVSFSRSSCFFFLFPSLFYYTYIYIYIVKDNRFFILLGEKRTTLNGMREITFPAFYPNNSASSNRSLPM